MSNLIILFKKYSTDTDTHNIHPHSLLWIISWTNRQTLYLSTKPLVWSIYRCMKCEPSNWRILIRLAPSRIAWERGEYFQTSNLCTSFQKAAIPSTGSDHNTGGTFVTFGAIFYCLYIMYTKCSMNEEHDSPLWPKHGTIANAHDIDFIWWWMARQKSSISCWQK